MLNRSCHFPKPPVFLFKPFDLFLRVIASQIGIDAFYRLRQRSISKQHSNYNGPLEITFPLDIMFHQLLLSASANGLHARAATG